MPILLAHDPSVNGMPANDVGIGELRQRRGQRRPHTAAGGAIVEPKAEGDSQQDAEPVQDAKRQHPDEAQEFPPLVQHLHHQHEPCYCGGGCGGGGVCRRA